MYLPFFPNQFLLKCMMLGIWKKFIFGFNEKKSPNSIFNYLLTTGFFQLSLKSFLK